VKSVGFRSGYMDCTNQDQSKSFRTVVYATGPRERENRGSENPHPSTTQGCATRKFKTAQRLCHRLHLPAT